MSHYTKEFLLDRTTKRIRELESLLANEVNSAKIFLLESSVRVNLVLLNNLMQ